LALRRVATGARSYAIASDKSRGSGKDWLSSLLQPYEGDRIGWMNPVVLPDSI
jgi:hypothetical protein